MKRSFKKTSLCLLFQCTTVHGSTNFFVPKFCHISRKKVMKSSRLLEGLGKFIGVFF